MSKHIIAGAGSNRRFGNARLKAMAFRVNAASRKVETLNKISVRLSNVLASSEASFSEKQLADIQLAENEKALAKAIEVETSKKERLEFAVSHDKAIISGQKKA